MSERKVLVQARELALMPAGEVLIVDCRSVLGDPAQGRRDYLQAHVPRAVYASLNQHLSDLAKPGLGRHPLPDADAFARSLASWGWRPGQRVVAYDASGGAMAAARLWWMLGAVGIDAQVLDGGWQAWLAASLPVAAGAVASKPGEVPSLRFDPARMVSYAELEQPHRQAPALVVDARAAVRFRGESEPIDRVAGHVPGARNRPVAQNLGANGCFKDAAVLRGEFATLLGQRKPGDVVHMCGSGVFACQNLLAMEVAGLAGSRVFVPSWSGWSSDPARPVATGPA